MIPPSGWSDYRDPKFATPSKVTTIISLLDINYLMEG